MEKTSNLQRLKNLGIGEQDRFPVSSTPSIRSAIGTYSRVWGKRYRTVSEGQELVVTRIS